MKVVKVKPGPRAPLFGQDSKVVRGSKKVSPNPAPENPAEKIVSGSPELFVGDRQSEKHRSLISRPAELFVEDRLSENRRSLISQPAELVFESDFDKTESSDFQRCRADSASGQLNYQPFPRIKLTRKISSAYEKY